MSTPGRFVSAFNAQIAFHDVPLNHDGADPYLNVDAGTMSPFEHGEVFVLDDGGEVRALGWAKLDSGRTLGFPDWAIGRVQLGCAMHATGTSLGVPCLRACLLQQQCILRVAQADLDLGNYERFLDISLSKDNNLTTGKIYQARRHCKAAGLGGWTGHDGVQA